MSTSSASIIQCSTSCHESAAAAIRSAIEELSRTEFSASVSYEVVIADVVEQSNLDKLAVGRYLPGHSRLWRQQEIGQEDKKTIASNSFADGQPRSDR